MMIRFSIRYGAFGLLALSLFAACRDESADEGYAVVASEPFTFDETAAAANTIRVVANTSWQVFWIPEEAAAAVEPASGSGNGSFRVVDMPRGARIEFGVRTASGAVAGNSVAVTRAAESQNPDPDPDPDPEEPAGYRFPELPSDWVQPAGTTAAVRGDRAYFTHWSRSVKSNRRVRNYSYCYDTRRHNPLWVAYPLHEVYREGGFGRTDPDPWSPDPAFDAAFQSRIYRSDGPSGTDEYQFWSQHTMASGYWSKGHLCMSRERGGKDTELNMQTFYPSNIAPQSSAAASSFARVWSYVEALFSGTGNYGSTDIAADDGEVNINVVADTLFLVAGCYYEHDAWQETDASNWNTPSAVSKTCIMPTHQWKMGLRTRKGNTGKKIAECSADELQAVAFWIEAMTPSTETSASAELRAIAVPVSFVEQKMGVEFFPGVPDEVKQSYDPDAWGF